MKKTGEILLLIMIAFALAFLYLVCRYGMWYLIVVFQRIMHLIGLC